MSEGIPQEIIDKAQEIFDESEAFNRMAWEGPYLDSLRLAMEYMWVVAGFIGYKEGLEEGGCDYCRD